MTTSADPPTDPPRVDGAELRPSAEQARMMEYLRTRAAALSPSALQARIRAAADELDAQLQGLGEASARAHPLPGQWSVAEVVDHLAQTQIRAVDELGHLLDGRRPPAPPVYDGLTSGAAGWAPWRELVDGLRAANAELDSLLVAASRAAPPAGGPTARTILVVNRATPGGGTRPETFDAELDWKEYALVQRLHLLDHRSQVRALRALLDPRPH